MHTHVPSGLAATVDAIAKSLAPGVERIRYTLGEDWSGNPAIHFRVVLSDAASRHPVLPATTNRVRDQLRSKLDFDAMGLYDYYNFRGLSECERLRDKDWE